MSMQNKFQLYDVEYLALKHADKISVEEQNYDLLLKVVLKQLLAGKTPEEVMLHLKIYTKNLMTNEHFQATMMWVFDREEYLIDQHGRHGYPLLLHVFHALSFEWKSDSTFEKLNLTAPKIQVTAENAKVVLQMFACIQCLQFIPKFLDYQQRRMVAGSFRLFIAGLVIVAVCAIATAKLAEAGGVVFATILGAVFGLAAMIYSVRRPLKEKAFINKYTRESADNELDLTL